MLYVYVCLARFRLLPCFVPFVGLCLLVFGAICLYDCILPLCGLFWCNCLWDISPWCWFAWGIPLSALCDNMLALLALCPRLSFFTSLHLCTFAYMFMDASLRVLVSSSLISTNLVRVHTCSWHMRPWVLLGILLDGSGRNAWFGEYTLADWIGAEKQGVAT